MPIRLDDPRPPYEQLAAELREAIHAGEYRPGDKLPSTRRLAQDNGISPMTVQHAMKVLREEGLVVSHHGRGIYVQEPARGAEAAEPAEPKTLDEALAVLAEVQQRLDRLEAQGTPATPEAAPAAPEAEPDAGIDP